MRRLLVIGLAAVLAGCGGGAPGAVPGVTSTLHGTLTDPDGDGTLERAPGEPLLDRGGTGAAGPVLATLVQLSDTQVRDEESPARAPFLDRRGPPFTSTFRPHEALSTHVLAAAVRAANALAPDAAFVTGDLLDSASRAELDQALAILDGGEVDPDTGAPGYEGVQEAGQPDPFFYRPDLDAPRHPGLLAAAARRFRSPGLRAPWYPALGNHDLLVQGETPPTAALDAFATSGRMVVGLDGPVPSDPSAGSAAAVRDRLAAGAVERERTISPDPDRRLLRPPELIRALATRDAAPPALAAAAGRRTLDYTVDLGAEARALVLDTVDRTGGARGALRPPQLAWLRAQLRRAGDRALLVFSHNPLDGTDGGEAALRALAATPAAVVAVIAGNGHRNSIRPHPAGFWQIATSSLADFPMQVRALRLRRGPGGGHVLETWMLDHDGAGLAGTARELAFLDAHGGRPQGFAGARADRNARLIVAP